MTKPRSQRDGKRSKTGNMKTEALITVKSLSAAFLQNGEHKQVLHSVDFSLSAGETLGIVGESGSGKSVSSLSIMRLIPSPPIQYESGKILYGENEVDLLLGTEKQMESLRGSEIAMIFQEPMTSLNPLKRCGLQVAEALSLHKNLNKEVAKKKVLELFDKVQLPSPERIFKSYPHELSGGQKQRVMIAMAISCEPKLLIADEPTTALDVTVQRGILELLKKLQKDTGMAMIFISHDLAVVSQVAENIMVMHHGRIVEYGKSHQVLQHPENDYTKGLLSSRPPTSGRPHRLATVDDFLGDTPMEISYESLEERKAHLQRLYAKRPILEARGLHTWYPIKKGMLNRVHNHLKAVNGVSLELHQGETLGIVGESGCGKSTLGRTILGLEEAKHGSIIYHGTDVADMSNTEKKKMTREVQMIFQDPYSSLDPRMSIGEAIKEPMQVHEILANEQARKQKVMELLERVGLDNSHYHRYPHEFSGGQRQRICIARALSMEPKVVICDESVSALDVSVQAQVLNLLNELKEDLGLSYLFISHDLSVVRYMSDRVLVMNAGEVVEYREADVLYSNPNKDYTKRLIESAYSFD